MTVLSKRCITWIVAVAILLGLTGVCPVHATAEDLLEWRSLPQLPDELGLAGPLVGVEGNALIVAGGANFPRPVWETQKRWHDRIHVLVKNSDGVAWRAGGTLARPVAYSAVVSTPDGVVCLGGNQADVTFRECFLLHWNTETQTVDQTPYPSLPQPCAAGQAALIGSVIYLAGGQSGPGLDSAMKNLWSLDLSKRSDPAAFQWREIEPWPGEARAFNLTVSQHNGHDDCLYVMSGRCLKAGETRFLKDVWEYTPRSAQWRRRADLPECRMAGAAIGWGTRQIYVLSGDSGALFSRTEELRDKHPGFPKEAFVYDTLTDQWTSAGAVPENMVTTPALLWNGEIILASGEVRPRVRTPSVWSIVPKAK